MVKRYKFLNFINITFFVAGFFFFTASCSKSNSLTNEVEDLKKKAHESVFNNPEYSRELVNKIYAMTDDPAQRADLDHILANIYFYDSQFDSTLFYLNRIQEYCENESPSPMVYRLRGVSSGIRGHMFVRQNMPDSALIYYQRSYEYMQKGDREDLLPPLCINLADAHSHNGNYELCAYYYRRALHQIDSLKLPPTNVPAIYSGLGQAYVELRNFEQSDYYYELAEQYFDEMNIMDKSYHLNNRGNHYYMKKDYDRAFDYFSRLKELSFNESDNIYYQSLCALNLAEVFLIRGEIDSSRYYISIAEPFFKRINFETALYHIHTLRIGIALQKGDWKETEILIRASETPTHVAPTILNIRQSFLKEYFEKTGNYKSAYLTLVQEKQLEDSLRNETVKKNVAEIEFRYQQDTTLINRNLLIQKQENEAKTLKYSLFSILLICLFLAVGIILTIMYTLKQREYLRIKNRSQIIDLKMESIRNRIFPHFIFNNLNRILHSPEEAEIRLTHLAEMIQLLRKNLELVEQHIISLQEELNFVEQYIRVEQYALGEAFSYILQLSPDIQSGKIYLPSMMIQIPVENAIKHGLKIKEGKKVLHIDIHDDIEFVYILITDNGPGFSPYTNLSDDHTGTGLKVINQTIHLYNSINKDKISMEITNIEEDKTVQGCRVRITLPKHMDYSQNR